jgi:crotonobetainyl-CoA:carnitine CoA-transferase CaiB-like acyl-CoA transferase
MRRPPELGEHNAEVLGSIGIGAGELERLKRGGVV